MEDGEQIILSRINTVNFRRQLALRNEGIRDANVENVPETAEMPKV
jgi:hypothetical protein